MRFQSTNEWCWGKKRQIEWNLHKVAFYIQSQLQSMEIEEKLKNKSLRALKHNMQEVSLRAANWISLQFHTIKLKTKCIVYKICNTMYSVISHHNNSTRWVRMDDEHNKFVFFYVRNGTDCEMETFFSE